jgi:hypothetical protein
MLLQLSVGPNGYNTTDPISRDHVYYPFPSGMAVAQLTLTYTICYYLLR